MSVTSESSFLVVQRGSSKEDSVHLSARQLGAPSSGCSGVLNDMYAVDRSRSPLSPQGQPINSKLTTHRDPQAAMSASVPSDGPVVEASQSPQDVVVQQLTSREWETSELAGPREHFPTDSAALNAPAAPAARPQLRKRTASTSGGAKGSGAVQRGSSHLARVSAARSPRRVSVAAEEDENLAPGQRPRRASLYHDVGPVPRTPRRSAGSEKTSAAGAHRPRSASASKYKNVRSVVRDYMNNVINEDEARYSVLRARSPYAGTPRARTNKSPAPRAVDELEVSPDSEAGAAAPVPMAVAPSATRARSSHTPRAMFTFAQQRSLLPPNQRAHTPTSQLKVGRDFVPRCATMIPERLKYHPKPIVATDECEPTTVDSVPYAEYCEAQAERQQQQAVGDVRLKQSTEASFSETRAVPYSSRAASIQASRPASRATSRGRSANPESRPRRADPLQIADEDFVVPVTVDSEALSREDPYAPPKWTASARRGVSPRAGSRRASRSRTPRSRQQRGVSSQQTPRGSAIVGSRASQASTQGVNPYSYRRKLVFSVAAPDLSLSTAVVPVS